MRVTIQRDRPHRVFRSRDAFLKRRGGFVADMLSTLRSKDIATADEPQNRIVLTELEKLPWSGQPWITPVIGSGPLGLPRAFTAVERDIPAAVLERLRRERAFDGFEGVGADEERWVTRFISAIVRERVDHELAPKDRTGEATDEELHRPGSSVDPGLIERINPVAALLVLVSAQLTRTFHRVRLDTCRAMSRWGADVSGMPFKHDRRQALDDEYVRLLLRAIGLALEATSKRAPVGRHNEVMGAVDRLLEQIRDGLHVQDGAEIRISTHQLQQVTEVAWLMLVDSVAGRSYPGWTELLLYLVLANSDADSDAQRRPRWQQIGELATHVSKLILPVTEDVWMTSLQAEGRVESEEQAENRKFYDAVASAMWAQHAVRSNWPTTQTEQLPQPISYVCSFDYELEMAMWRTAPEGGTFSMLVPAYAVASTASREAEFVWLEGMVRLPSVGDRAGQDPQAQQEFLRALRTPDEWRLVFSGKGGRPLDDYVKHPVIVRLAGSPLVTLPDLASHAAAGSDDVPENYRVLVSDMIRSGLEPERRPGDRQPMQFVHAVTVDEYLALRQLEAEWLWSRDSTNEHESNRGLPEHFFTARTSDPTRYWMIMGVPLRDPAIRLRLLSVLARQHALPLTGTSAAEPQAPPAEAVPDAVPGPVPVVVAAAPTQEATSLADGSAVTARRRQPGQAGADNATTSNDAPSQPRASAPAPRSEASPGHEAMVQPTGRFGLSINTVVADEEVVLLGALGFEVVTDKCENFAVDLHGYAEWLAKTADRLHRIVAKVKAREDANASTERES